MINKKLQKKLYESLRDCNIHIAAGTEAILQLYPIIKITADGEPYVVAGMEAIAQKQFDDAHKHYIKAISLLDWTNNMFKKIQDDWEGTVPIDEWSL